MIGLIRQLDLAAQAAYANLKIEPGQSDTVFRQNRGLGPAGIVPGNQLHTPYGLQFNLGFQRRIKPGTVLTLDYIQNHAVGLPFLQVDLERRRDAETLNIAAARAQVNRTLGTESCSGQHSTRQRDAADVLATDMYR